MTPDKVLNEYYFVLELSKDEGNLHKSRVFKIYAKNKADAMQRAYRFCVSFVPEFKGFRLNDSDMLTNEDGDLFISYRADELLDEYKEKAVSIQTDNPVKPDERQKISLRPSFTLITVYEVTKRVTEDDFVSQGMYTTLDGAMRSFPRNNPNYYVSKKTYIAKANGEVVIRSKHINR